MPGGARLASIHIYPLKAGRAIDLDESLVEPWGLAGDRRWLLVTPDGGFITQRDEPRIAVVDVEYAADGSAVTVSAKGRSTLTVPAPSEQGGAEMIPVSVWSSTVAAASAGPVADAWFSAHLDRPVRLVHLDDPTRRVVRQDFGRPEDRVSFADGFPLLLTTTGSLDALGDWLVDGGHTPVPMNRFRPNVVVAGTPAWAEDGWRRVRIGTVDFRVAKPCGRCVVTTIDQATGERTGQPLKTLGRYRRFGQELVFGQNLIPDAPGVIRLGDAVRVVE